MLLSPHPKYVFFLLKVSIEIELYFYLEKSYFFKHLTDLNVSKMDELRIGNVFDIFHAYGFTVAILNKYLFSFR